MAGSVIEVKTSLPECLSCEVIEIDADASMEKFCVSKTQGSHRGDGEMLFFFLSQRSDNNGSCDIGCSFIILSAGIHEVHGSEARLNVAFLLFSEGFQFLCNGNFVHRDFADVFL